VTDHIRLDRDELYAPAVDQALETRRVLVERALPALPEISPLRRFLMSPMTYLPVAGFLAALLVWLLIEPHFVDQPVIGGEVTLVQSDPFEFSRYEFTGGRPLKLTVGRRDVLVLTDMTRLEEGANGEAPFASWVQIESGDFVEVVGTSGDEAGAPADLVALAVRPATRERALAAGQDTGDSVWAGILLFPATALMITVFLLLAEGISSRNWTRTVERVLLGGLLTVVFAFLAYLPAGIFLLFGQLAVQSVGSDANMTGKEIPGVAFLLFTAARGGAWAAIGAGLGLGMNLVRSTRTQLRNSVVGGVLGGALGGVIFGALERVLGSSSFFADAAPSRLFGLLAVGVSVGVFVALVERYAREAWLRVRTGPLAGKAFVLYRSPTRVGSDPRMDVYLFKDAAIDPTHALIHQTGNRFEIESVAKRGETVVSGEIVRRRRLQPGDTIRLGDTVLEFEERAATRSGGTR
jgi:hypothetical protein